MAKLTGEQRYRQAHAKAFLILHRNLRAFEAGELPFLPGLNLRECLIQELDRAYRMGRADASGRLALQGE